MLSRRQKWPETLCLGVYAPYVFLMETDGSDFAGGKNYTLLAMIDGELNSIHFLHRVLHSQLDNKAATSYECLMLNT